MLLAGVRVHEVGEFFTRAELFKSREKPHAAPGPIFCLRGAFYIASGTKTTTFGGFITQIFLLHYDKALVTLNDIAIQLFV